jgi:hypothetical protein
MVRISPSIRVPTRLTLSWNARGQRVLTAEIHAQLRRMTEVFCLRKAPHRSAILGFGMETLTLPRRRTWTRQKPVGPTPYKPESRDASFSRLWTIAAGPGSTRRFGKGALGNNAHSSDQRNFYAHKERSKRMSRIRRAVRNIGAQ